MSYSLRGKSYVLNLVLHLMGIKKISNFDKVYDTSFNGLQFKASTKKIIGKFGEPDYRNEPTEKVTREWDLELEDGTPFTIYDYAEYRRYGDNKVVNWHVGTTDKDETNKVKEALIEIGLYK